MSPWTGGLVAVSTTEGEFLSWRLLGPEANGATATGLAGPNFAGYRNGDRIAEVADSTNYADPDGTAQDQYSVAPVVNGVELAASSAATAWDKGFHAIPLTRPTAGITPAGSNYTYSANDVSVGDADGDDAYEFVVKRDPSDSKNVSQVGCTGPVFIDAYRLDGTLLNRIDLGVNIRAGAHYNQFLVYDFDGDGRSETILKTAPGTKSIGLKSNGAVSNESFVTYKK